jgi:SlyX protein
MPNSTMDYPHDIEQRLIDLEIKASFSEDTVDQLNQVIVRQQQQIDGLLHEISQLRQQIPASGTGTASGRAADDLPPHY